MLVLILANVEALAMAGHLKYTCWYQG